MKKQNTPPHKDDLTLYFQNRDELAKVELSKVMYFESNCNYSKVVFANGYSITIFASLSIIEGLLEGLPEDIAAKFHRVGRFIVINTDFLFQINVIHQQLTLTDGVNPKVFTLKASKESLRNLKSLYEKNPMLDEIE